MPQHRGTPVIIETLKLFLAHACFDVVLAVKNLFEINIFTAMLGDMLPFQA